MDWTGLGWTRTANQPTTEFRGGSSGLRQDPGIPSMLGIGLLLWHHLERGSFEAMSMSSSMFFCFFFCFFLFLFKISTQGTLLCVWLFVKMCFHLRHPKSVAFHRHPPLNPGGPTVRPVWVLVLDPWGRAAAHLVPSFASCPVQFVSGGSYCTYYSTGRLLVLIRSSFSSG